MHFAIKIAAIFGLLSISTAAWPGFDYAPLDLESFENTNQFFEQSASGLYAYGYRAPHAAKQEVRTLDGVTRGFYSYVDANGELQSVQYIADADGFRVAATNLPRVPTAALPQPVTETPEVAAARAQHLAAYEAVKLRNSLPRQAGGFQEFQRSKTATLRENIALPQYLKRNHRRALKQAADLQGVFKSVKKTVA